MLYVAVWYVSIRPVVMRVKEERIYFSVSDYLLLISGVCLLKLSFSGSSFLVKELHISYQMLYFMTDLTYNLQTS